MHAPNYSMLLEQLTTTETTPQSIPQAREYYGALDLYGISLIEEYENALFDDPKIPCSAKNLMALAARSALQSIRNSRALKSFRKALIVCGGGNNGGDGYALAAMLADQGLVTEIVQLPNDCKASDATKLAAKSAADAGVRFIPFDRFLEGPNSPSFENHCTLDPSCKGAELPRGVLLIDAIFGIGLNRPLIDEAAAAVARLNSLRAEENASFLVALDLPSGLCAQTGAIFNAAITADKTVTFLALKPGLICGSGPTQCGKVELARLLPNSMTIEQFYAARNRTDKASERIFSQYSKSSSERKLLKLVRVNDLQSWTKRLFKRKLDAHKGSSGTGLLIAGAEGMSGAAILAAQSALYSGLGKAVAVTHATTATAMSITQPEIITHKVASGAQLNSVLDQWMLQCQATLIGPGLSQSAWGQQLAQTYAARCIKQVSAGQIVKEGPKDNEQGCSNPLIVDGCALSMLADSSVFNAKALVRASKLVLTPHPKEAARLLGTDTATVQANRVAACRQIVETYQAVVILKGVGTLVAAPNEPMYIIGAGSPSLATAGSGDVLAGLLLSLICQHAYDLNESTYPTTAGGPSNLLELAVVAALLHAMAGEALSTSQRLIGGVAGELPLAIRSIINTHCI